MKKSIKVHPKKRRGRPATGKDPLVSARLPQPLVDQVGHWAASNEASRSEAIRRLVELGLKAKK
jgi:Ribbon-helix-helix protein, copG family